MVALQGRGGVSAASAGGRAGGGGRLSDCAGLAGRQGFSAAEVNARGVDPHRGRIPCVIVPPQPDGSRHLTAWPNCISVRPMSSELLQDRAALYVAGALTAPERESFELVLEFQDDLRAHVARLQDVGAKVLLAQVPRHTAAPSSLKSRILDAIETRPRQLQPDSLVVTGPNGLIEWANPAFSAMCGYSMAELKGRKPGHVLQGPETDPAAVQRIREAVRERRSCRETLLNYHKDGSLYRVDVAITPILDDEGAPLWYVAKERKLVL